MFNRYFAFLLFIMFTIYPTFVLAEHGGGHPFFGAAIEGLSVSEELILQIENETIAPAHIILLYLQWPEDAQKSSFTGRELFPKKTLSSIWDNGCLPVLTWEPFINEKGKEVMISFDDIVKGKYDAYINYMAKESASFEHPFIMRFAHEMNIIRYHWGTDAAGFGPGTPEKYIMAFRYVVTAFRKAEAKNVIFAFCPNAENVPDFSYDKTAEWNRITAYYPGDGFVDVLGFDGYNWGNTRIPEKHGWRSYWRSFMDMMGPAYKTLKEINPEKPVMVFETATAPTGGDKSVWINDMMKTAKEWDLKAVIWFQVKKEVDWRFQTGLNRNKLKFHTIQNREVAKEWAEEFVRNKNNINQEN